MALVVVVLLGVAILLGVAVLLGLTDSPMSVEPVDCPDDGLPDRPLTSHDVGRLRFRVGLRGYRMDDVDRALDRLRDALYDAEQRAVTQPQVEVETESPPTRPRRRAKAADADDEAPESGDGA